MAGTDHSQKGNCGGPAIILVEPQLGENIGACARAMFNFGLVDLRLVRPRDGWPSEKAIAASSRAIPVLDQVKLYDSTEEAISDLGYVLASTARPRDMLKKKVYPEDASIFLRQLRLDGTSSGIIFGREATGLHNDDVALADAILSIPTNPSFASLNLAQAVLIVAYEWFLSGAAPHSESGESDEEAPASREQLLAFFQHLEGELDSGGFLKPPEKKPKMVRNLRNLFHRAGLTDQEVRTLRGVVSALTRNRKV